MPTTTPTHTPLAELLARHWGYDSFLPNQQEAVETVLNRQDSLVVLPTGGGKSLCYQLPILACEGMAVVISPLLSLIKDQIDALGAMKVPAASLNSTMSADERRAVRADVREGRIKLLYLSPEALSAQDGEPADNMLELLRDAQVRYVAIDEAHCISQWGHEYRPAYRALGRLRSWLPGVGLHAFTATATPAVQDDVIRNLGLKDATTIIGSYDRPNLTYRSRTRNDLVTQVRQVLDRHAGEAGIVYCIRKADVDELAATLKKQGYRALPYHAGMPDAVRQKNQEAFINEDIDIIVATVAFGMGIDRSDVRFVIHAGMPKAIENYQQEAGRAGRDGLEAECVLLYGPGDMQKWRMIMDYAKEREGGHGGNAAERSAYDEAAWRRVAEMYRFAQTPTCRHKFLVEYFGQEHHGPACNACDVCLGEVEEMPDALLLAQKIISGVARVRDRYGARYVAEMLHGSKTARIKENGHEELSTYGLLAEYPIPAIADWIDQLVGQGFLVREGEFQTIMRTPAAREILRGEGEVKLGRPAALKKATKSSKATRDGTRLVGAEGDLFEDLRRWRHDLARSRGVPPYVICGDATLRDLASKRPTSASGLRAVHGLGEKRIEAFGAALLDYLAEHVAMRGLNPVPQAAEPTESPGILRLPRLAKADKPDGDGDDAKSRAFGCFKDGGSVAAVAVVLGRAESTVGGYLLEYLEATGETNVSPWVDAATYARIKQVATDIAADRLKPIFEALGGDVTYLQIRIALLTIGREF